MHVFARLQPHAIRRVLWALAIAVASSAAGVASAQQEPSIEVLETPSQPASESVVQEPAPPPPCGTQPITMARMQWPSSALLTEVHARILGEHFSCEVRIQETDMATAGSSMGANGQPAVAPEMWISRIADIWNAAINAQQVRQGGTSYAEAVFEGWFVPDYAVQQWPEIVTIEGLRTRATELAGPGRRPKFITCPIDWACHVINRNLLRAHGLEGLFEVIEPANRFELDTLIAEAVGRRDPIVFYYWQPNAILAQFAFHEVGLGPYNKDNFVCMGRSVCATPLPTSFAPDPVIVAVSEWVYLEAPQVASYFQRAKMPFAEMNRMLQQLSETGATVEGVAGRFIAERGAVWRPWVGLSVEGARSAADEAIPEGSEQVSAPEEEPAQVERRTEPEPQRESPNVIVLPPPSLVN